jgi:hypothetical protein
VHVRLFLVAAARELSLQSPAARLICDSKFAGQPGQRFVRCPERRIGDKGGSEQMRIDPPDASAVQLV